MQHDLDAQIKSALHIWQAPAASEDAVARLLRQAALTPANKYRRFQMVRARNPLQMFGSVAAAAALLIGIAQIHQIPFGAQNSLGKAAPHSEMALQQSALSAFALNDHTSDDEDLS